MMRMKVEGLKELDKALGELSKAAARGVLRRSLIKAAEPLRATAQSLAPRDTGRLARSIIVSSKIDNRAGKKEFAQVMQSGGSRAQAVQALRDARRAKGIGESFAEVHVGPRKGGKRDSIKAIVQEFGSATRSPQPYMRPAFDAKKRDVVNRVRGELRTELDKAIKRARARALRKGKAK